MNYIGNWPLLERAIEQIIDHPEHYWQGEYVVHLPGDPHDFTRSLEFEMADAGKCGTTRCVAGWVAHLAGYTDPPAVRGKQIQVISPDGCIDFVPMAAMAALRLGGGYASSIVESNLFYGNLSWRQVLNNARYLAHHDGYELSVKILHEMETQGL